MSTLKLFFIFGMMLAYSQLLHANNGENGEKKSLEASVHGSVMDATTGKPVIGVTISVTSNKLRNGKEIQSDSFGCFSFAKLTPGNITLMFEKKGYKLARRDLASVKDGSTTTVSVDFEPIEESGNEIWHPLLKLLN